MTRVAAVPDVVLTADGVNLGAASLRALTSVRVQQRLSLPSLCELSFSQPPQETADALALGAALHVAVSGREPLLFDGDVTACEHVYGPSGARELRVRGYDRLHRLRKRQAARARQQVSAGDLARELAGSLGLSVQASAHGPVWQTLIQHRQSDFELLTEVTERAGLYFTIADGTLRLLTLEGAAGGGGTIPLVLGRTLLEAAIEVNGEPACRQVTTSGWDPLRAEARAGRATSARNGRQVGADSGRSGADGGRFLLDEAVQSAEQAEALAQAELDWRVAGEVTFRGVAEGDPRLRPGARVDVSGVADRLAGRYVLASVTHTIDALRGFVSQLSTAPPRPQPRPAATVMALGVVSAIDDPEKLGRVKVTLPAYDGVETDWMGVLAAGAGGGKGIMSMPDRNDQVLVLFAHEDPVQGIVLGGLYGAGGPPDSGIDGGAVRRFTLLTPGGQRVRLDDQNGAIRLENSDGSFVELSKSGVHLSAARDLVIEAPGKSIVIRGQTVDFQKG